MLKLVLWLSISVLVVCIDQASKQWVLQLLQPGEGFLVAEYFNLVLAFNSGAAFSFLSNASGWQRPLFTVIALIATQVIIYLMYKHREQVLFCLALSFILGGAVGNLWDRIMLGHVVDFLQFHYKDYYWPAFNAADSAITLGAVLLVWDSFSAAKKSKPRAAIKNG